jgi:hypothetical protein
MPVLVILGFSAGYLLSGHLAGTQTLTTSTLVTQATSVTSTSTTVVQTTSTTLTYFTTTTTYPFVITETSTIAYSTTSTTTMSNNRFLTIGEGINDAEYYGPYYWPWIEVPAKGGVTNSIGTNVSTFQTQIDVTNSSVGAVVSHDTYLNGTIELTLTDNMTRDACFAFYYDIHDGPPPMLYLWFYGVANVTTDNCP